MHALSIHAYLIVHKAARVAARNGRLDPTVAAFVVAAFAPVVCGAYLVKSALGINLMPGPSPLHDLLYHFLR